jgi:hypothetical protein
LQQPIIAKKHKKITSRAGLNLQFHSSVLSFSIPTRGTGQAERSSTILSKHYKVYFFEFINLWLKSKTYVEFNSFIPVTLVRQKNELQIRSSAFLLFLVRVCATSGASGFS